MGVLGTGVIAGVANSALQAQQLGRKRDKQARDAKRAAERLQEMQRIRVEGLEEDDAAEDATRLHIDGQVPDHERHNQSQPQPGHAHHPAPPTGAYANSPDTVEAHPLTEADTDAAPSPADAVGSEGETESTAPPEPQSHVAAAYQHHDPHAEPHTKPTLDLEG